MGNAIKFTHQGEVKLTAKGKPINGQIHYHFDVTDTGIGLAPNDMERIFNEFEQAGDGKQQLEGTGLGLSISHDIIVKQHSGTIAVDTEPGKFTEFKIVLPRKPAALETDQANGRPRWTIAERSKAPTWARARWPSRQSRSSTSRR